LKNQREMISTTKTVANSTSNLHDDTDKLNTMELMSLAKASPPPPHTHTQNSFLQHLQSVRNLISLNWHHQQLFQLNNSHLFLKLQNLHLFLECPTELSQQLPVTSNVCQYHKLLNTSTLLHPILIPHLLYNSWLLSDVRNNFDSRQVQKIQNGCGAHAPELRYVKYRDNYTFTWHP
jgi:hypothetical protein